MDHDAETDPRHVITKHNAQVALGYNAVLRELAEAVKAGVMTAEEAAIHVENAERFVRENLLFHRNGVEVPRSELWGGNEE